MFQGCRTDFSISLSTHAQIVALPERTSAARMNVNGHGREQGGPIGMPMLTQGPRLKARPTAVLLLLGILVLALFLSATPVRRGGVPVGMTKPEPSSAA